MTTWRCSKSASRATPMRCVATAHCRCSGTECVPGRRRQCSRGVALVALLGYRVLPMWSGGNPRSFTAQAGGTSLSLEGGVHVVLAPGSTLAVAGRHDTRLTLDGSAWFEVTHDPQRVLTITAGSFQLRDIGTRFEVVSGGALLKVAVTEGELSVQMPGRADSVAVHAGQRLLVAGDPPHRRIWCGGRGRCGRLARRAPGVPQRAIVPGGIASRSPRRRGRHGGSCCCATTLFWCAHDR